ncbi:hypothetical protein GE09DRAFT_1262901 [Coniochaeta sp. 2T2.1]|nr:hypothetical protein GE09DRAFT_1262901 [Coniochaeta sp. 2T2.1]
MTNRVASAALVALGLAVQLVSSAAVPDAARTCQTIDRSISNTSDVVYPVEALTFANDIHHYYATSQQTPACVLEARSPGDLSVALKIIGDTRTPFAVMSGGHEPNPGHSSTTGVHISLKFDQVVFSRDNSTVEIGTGQVTTSRYVEASHLTSLQTWSDVYKKLDGTGYNIVGGRVPGPGVGGLILGGGFSWKTSQFGLTCDTVKQYNLVLPNGTITAVTAAQKDLFFALKGGLNRFGVVTSIVLPTHKQPDIWGGLVIYPGDKLDEVLNATSTFSQKNKDPKAQLITTMMGTVTSGVLGITPLVLFFYDGPNRPAAFDAFNFTNITPLLDLRKSQSFYSFQQSFPSDDASILNIRGTSHTLSTNQLTPGFVEAVRAEQQAYVDVMLLHSGTAVYYSLEPFVPGYGRLTTDSAYPHSDSPFPLDLTFSWSDPKEDAFWYKAMRDSVDRLRKVAIREGSYNPRSTLYPNYAIAGTPVEDLYGAANTQRLRAIRRQVDPWRIMDLAGGFDL